MAAPQRAKDPSRIITSDIPLVSGTTYRVWSLLTLIPLIFLPKNQFVNWGSLKPIHEKASMTETVVKGIPFRGKTLYSESFSSKCYTERSTPVSLQKK